MLLQICASEISAPVVGWISDQLHNLHVCNMGARSLIGARENVIFDFVAAYP